MLILSNCSVLWREISEVEGEQSTIMSLVRDKEKGEGEVKEIKFEDGRIKVRAMS